MTQPKVLSRPAQHCTFKKVITNIGNNTVWYDLCFFLDGGQPDGLKLNRLPGNRSPRTLWDSNSVSFSGPIQLHWWHSLGLPFSRAQMKERTLRQGAPIFGWSHKASKIAVFTFCYYYYYCCYLFHWKYLDKIIITFQSLISVVILSSRDWPVNILYGVSKLKHLGK